MFRVSRGIKRASPFISRIANVVHQERRFYITLFLLSIPSIISPFFSRDTVIESLFYCIVSILDTNQTIFAVILILALIKHSFLKSTIRRIYIGANFFPFLLDTFMILNYGCLSDAATISVLLDTHPNEATDFVDQVVLNSRFQLKLISYVLFFVLLYYFLLKVFLTSSVVRMMTILALLYLFALPWKQWQLIPFYKFAKILSQIRDETVGFNRVHQSLTTKPITITRNDQSIPYVCFILGESIARHHMSLYGYPLKTSPYLEDRYKRGDIFVFRDAICGFPNTVESIKLMFTFRRQGEEGTWYKYTNLFQILKAAGYHSSWLSNQEFTGMGLNPSRVLSDLCDEAKFTRYIDVKSHSFFMYDDALLPLLDNSLKHATEPSFHLIHTLGAHLTYAHRYPPKFARFTAKDEAKRLTEKMKKMASHYDNAVLFDDYVIDSIIKRYENKKAAVFFVSDHGEEVYDSSRKRFGHDGYSRSNFMVDVPMLLYLSPSLRNERPDLVARIANSTSLPFMTDDIIHVLLDIMGIETPGYDPRKSVINPHFDSSRVRLSYGKPYDPNKDPEGRV